MLFAELAAFAALTGDGTSSADAAIVLLGLLLGCIYLLMQFSLALSNEAVDRHSRLYVLVPFIAAAISVCAVLGGGLLIYFQAR